MTSTPVMHDLTALDAETLGDLGCAHSLIDINTAAHARIVTHVAY
ncbi:hypothetical protein [Candidatus Poriferisodalis sp.]